MAQHRSETSCRTAPRGGWHPAFAVPSVSLARILRRQSRRGWQLLFVVLVGLHTIDGRAEAPVPGEVQAGTLFLRMTSGYESATALDTDVAMEVNGLVARVAVRQRFENTGPDWAEGIYVFPLPDTAAVDRMRLEIGERIIEGELREKEAARREYEEAKQEGRRTSLVEQERPNLFTTSVANIAPGETVVVEIEYLEELRYTDKLFSLRFPMTLTPRYMPGDPLADRQGSGWAADTSRVPDASRISPPVVMSGDRHKLTLSITLDAGLPLDVVASRYHPVTITETQGRYEIRLDGGSVPMDHDFELVWRPSSGHAPQAMLFAETVAGEPYYLLMVMPPTSAPLAPVPREMIFIVDTSGSMHGTSIEQARAALRRALDGLGTQDRFNVIEFNSYARALFPGSETVSPEALEAARRFVESLEAEGGTEMRPALELALQDSPLETHLRQVVFITDGAVGNEDELFSLIGDRLGGGRLFTIGIGSAPNGWFMRKSAEAGRGTFTMISSLAEVGEKMDRLFAKLEQPQVTDIAVEWPPGVTAEAYPALPPDLYSDEPVSLRARVTGAVPANGTVLVSGNTVGGAWARELSVATGLPTLEATGVAALWARARIDELMDQKRRGRDEDAVRADVIDTALTHHLVTPYTSLVAVDRTPARVADELLRRDLVANRLPWGQSMDAIFGFPATATASAELVATGSVLLALALLAWLAGRGGRNRHAPAH